MPFDFKELDEDLKKIAHDLIGIGCCKLCTLRFIGETEPISYTKTFRSLLSRENEESLPESKIQKSNPCVACLGCLQVSQNGDILDKIEKEIIAGDYDSSTFKVALTFPVSFQLRAHALWLYMVKRFPEHCRKVFPIDLVTINVKDVWKYVYAPYVGEKVSKKYDQNSSLNVTISVTYRDDLAESMSLLNVEEQLFGTKKNKKGRRQKEMPDSKEEMFSRKGVEMALKRVDVSEFTQHFNIPPLIPTSAALCESVSLCQESIYIAGRYNKLSRELSQTPWMIDGERRMEDSVEEIISDPLKLITHSQSSKFLSSGREDVDVRTLGRGRPFAVECIDPHRTCFSSQQLKSTMLQVNKNGMGKVAIRDLQLVSKSSLELLKKGEDTKTKEYCALCIVHGALPGNLTALNSVAPVCLSQRTPVRVLHRRPAAVRPRTIHRMRVEPIQTGDSADFSLFKLFVETQAGTYVKEFVHGDFGRTKPSVGELLGNVSVDILALDVMNVNLDWPPTLS
ncbi:tRNA pseudouridine synthase Pus10 [Nilaparvata lugens]|uniref:tRNA pseudouridine synthase Pus10 n=1 Tax=Nilaparvata lugens TaxID=108931 RepID=UPI00193EBA02|nr:tRNA pseudouridine synthase Pus10 [Nilaparvata lugens]